MPRALVLEAHGKAACAALHPIAPRALTTAQDVVHLPVAATWAKAFPEARALLQDAIKAIFVVQGKSAGVGQAMHLLVRIDVSTVRIWAWQLLPYRGPLGPNPLLEVLGKADPADVHRMMRAALLEYVWRREVVNISASLGADDAFPGKL